MNAKRGVRINGLCSIASAVLGVGCVLLVGCSNDRSQHDVDTGKPIQNDNEVTIDVMDFINKSGVEPRFPQLWIFDKTGTLISTERSYIPGQPLNIEVNKRGPVAEYVADLEEYLNTKEVRFDHWRQCGTDYCVVKLLPDPSLGHCEPCNVMQSQLDAYFSARDATVTYRTVLLTKPSS